MSMSCKSPARVEGPRALPRGLLNALIRSVHTTLSPTPTSTARVEGPRALLRGWLPAYTRLGPHALISLPILEQLRAFAGIGFL